VGIEKHHLGHLRGNICVNLKMQNNNNFGGAKHRAKMGECKSIHGGQGRKISQRGVGAEHTAKIQRFEGGVGLQGGREGLGARGPHLVVWEGRGTPRRRM